MQIDQRLDFRFERGETPLGGGGGVFWDLWDSSGFKTSTPDTLTQP